MTPGAAYLLPQGTHSSAARSQWPASAALGRGEPSTEPCSDAAAPGARQTRNSNGPWPQNSVDVRIRGECVQPQWPVRSRGQAVEYDRTSLLVSSAGCKMAPLRGPKRPSEKRPAARIHDQRTDLSQVDFGRFLGDEGFKCS